jgi:hypothetical protein
MKTATLIGITVMLCLAVSGSAAAQEQAPEKATHPEYDRRQVVPFLDATYVAFARARRASPGANDDTEVTFEADIVPNFVIRQTFFDVIEEEDVSVRARAKAPEFRFAWSLVGVPMVRLRMFINDTSSPVRTPSYMPKGTVQLFLFKLGTNDRLNLFNLQSTVGHHSNGQDGCLFEGQVRDETQDDSPCVPEAPADKTFIPVNRKDGSFSTNYVQIGVRDRNIALDPPAPVSGNGSQPPDRTSRRDATIGVELELNPDGFLGGGGIDADLSERYGQTRLSMLGGMAWRSRVCHRLETKGFIKRIFGTGDDVAGWAGSAELQCLFRETNWGAFVRYFAGQDYYNLAFQDDARRLQFGMTYSQEGFLRFRPRRTP